MVILISSYVLMASKYSSYTEACIHKCFALSLLVSKAIKMIGWVLMNVSPVNNVEILLICQKNRRNTLNNKSKELYLKSFFVPADLSQLISTTCFYLHVTADC